MNTKHNLILVKGEIKTSQITSCRYNPDTTKWDVAFQNGKLYSYAYQNIVWLKNPQFLNPNLYRIRKNGVDFWGIDDICVFQNGQDTYWHICFQDGRERDYRRSELEMEESCLSAKQAADTFEYLKQIANLSTLENKETGEKLLAKKFQKFSFVGRDSALAVYLNPVSESVKKKACEYIPIFPFGCNNSQYKAVKTAMEHQISVIQGPPGTGKTQTILNIIANILIQGKTVQIVSNNNAATENVYEKLASQKYNLGFVVAGLGSSEKKAAFIEQQNGTYPDFSSWKMEEADDKELQLEQIQKKSARLKTVFNKRERLAGLKQEYAQLITEQEYFGKYAEQRKVNQDAVKLRKGSSSENWMHLWQDSQVIWEKGREIGLWFKIKAFFRCWIMDWKLYELDISEMIVLFQLKYYEEKKRELSEQIKALEEDLNSRDKNLLEHLSDQSMRFLKNYLAEKYEGNGTQRKIFQEEELWKEPKAFLKEYPVILSTTFSSRNSLNSKVMYDYLIMDEASQVDIATGALALSCARNVVIVGDTKQLPNIVSDIDKEKSDAIFQSFQIGEGYRYTNSFLQSVLDVIPDVPQTLLREHYRCHPKIINFCNQKFYRGELVIMTADHGEEDVLSVVKTAEGNHARGHYSQRQIDVITQEIMPKYDLNPAETGIIAPYRDQVNALGKEIAGMEISTVHKFQGKEKETIIISTVDDEISEFADDPYLINVAVSRAKKRLLLVVTGNKQKKEHNLTDLVDYIQYNNFEVTDSKIYSVFDYLYKQYQEERKDYLQKHKSVSEYDSENLMYAVIQDVIADERYAALNVVVHVSLGMLLRDTELLNDAERSYAQNPATHLDFVLYNRMSKKPVLAIEVDGFVFHKEGSLQASRDAMKDHILELYGIPLLRFRTNSSGEREKLEEKLSSLMAGTQV